MPNATLYKQKKKNIENKKSYQLRVKVIVKKHNKNIKLIKNVQIIKKFIIYIFTIIKKYLYNKLNENINLFIKSSSSLMSSSDHVMGVNCISFWSILLLIGRRSGVTLKLIPSSEFDDVIISSSTGSCSWENFLSSTFWTNLNITR